MTRHLSDTSSITTQVTLTSQYTYINSQECRSTLIQYKVNGIEWTLGGNVQRKGSEQQASKSVCHSSSWYEPPDGKLLMPRDDELPKR